VKDSVRGALWSALLYPGSGQMFLNHFKRGMVFAVIGASGVLVMLLVVIYGTWTGLEHLACKGEEISIPIMFSVAVSSLVQVKLYLLPPLVLCWLVSIADAWRLGKNMANCQK